MQQNMFKDFDGFDVALALYHWLQHNWVGMDDKYEAFCKLTEPGMYKPSRSEEYFENITDEVQTVYDMLDDNNVGQALETVLNYESEEL